MQCQLLRQMWWAWQSCIVSKCRIGRAEFERNDLRNAGAVRCCGRCCWSRPRGAADNCLVEMAMIGEIDDDCEEMVGGAAAGSNAWRVDWLERELLEVLVRSIVDSLQTWQSRVGQQQRCQRGIWHVSSVHFFDFTMPSWSQHHDVKTLSIHWECGGVWEACRTLSTFYVRKVRRRLVGECWFLLNVKIGGGP